MRIQACLTSKNEHYCTPPEILEPMHRLLIPRGSGRKLIDPFDNPASQTLSSFSADGDEADGLTCDWSSADVFYTNCPYGSKMPLCIERTSYWGRDRGMPGLTLGPARDDTEWCQEHIFASADAWLHVRGRLTFWTVIAIDKRDALAVEDGEPIYLKRWFPWAEDDRLPEPFRPIAPGFAVGPELGSTGKPQAAPFPSLVAFWADRKAEEADPLDELDSLRELVRSAAPRMQLLRECMKEDRETKKRARDLAEWLKMAEKLLGSKRIADVSDLDRGPFDRLDLALAATKTDPHPLTVREFARHFLPLGTLTVRRGPLRGVWRSR